ncbi:MAG: aspartate aminotransferase family protein [Planctomycetales bacterium]|nr:aspartate aminotransferase family protein [Planctomycetales bacterium]
MGAHVWDQLSDLANVITAHDDRAETIIRMAPEADLIYTCYAPITSGAIYAAKNLKGIIKYGVGVDSINLDAATARGIPVAHCPHYGTNTVADQAFALLLAVARKIHTVDRDLRSNTWLWPELKYIGVDLTDKTIGLIGFGRIGKAMARRCLGFGMTIVAYDPYVDATTMGDANVNPTSLDELLEKSDFVSLHPVLTPETRHIIGASELAAMKRSAIVVNVSRGELIDEAALAAALQNGTIAGAGLDVFSKEPLAADNPFLSLDNVALSPHFAFYSKEAYIRLENDCLAAIEAILAGRIPKNVKNVAVLEQLGAADEANDCDAELLTEGDVNFSPHRRDWQSHHLSDHTQELLVRDERYFVRQSLSTPCLNAITACEGVYLTDADGRRVMDFHGNSAHQVGYAHPKVVEAIKQQLDELSFCPRRYTNDKSVELAQRLATLAPGDLNKVLFTPSGTAAIGIALKLARYATGRHETISMEDSFHGASLDAISIGGEALFRDGLGPLLPGCHRVQWPCDLDDANAIEQLMKTHSIGAVICEPMRCTTIDVPAPHYWQRVRQLCDHHGALLVFDEIPLALGRTGKLFCCEHFDVVPDILVIGKGLGGAIMPLAATIVRESLDVVPERALGHYTHEKNPVAAAAALATLDVIESEHLLARSQELGEWAVQRLQDVADRHEIISDVRGLGLSIGVELRRDGKKATDEADRILYDCLANGLSFKVSGGNVLTLTPPLTIAREQLAEAIAILENAIAAVAQPLQH